jgi:DNA-binding NarL/FixJ family response regulator
MSYVAQLRNVHTTSKTTIMSMHDEKKLNIHTTMFGIHGCIMNRMKQMEFLFPISHLCAYTEKIASSVVALSGSSNTRIPA